MQGKMRQDLYQELYEVENTHWWHWHKRAVVQSLLQKFASKGSVLDIGSGTGKILEELKEQGWKVAGIDGEKEAKEWSKKRGIEIALGDVSKSALPFKDNSFDAVLALDILEHLPNDANLLNEAKRIVKENGIIIITVPAYSWFFTYWDTMLGHQRRYSKKDVEKLSHACKVKTLFISYYMAGLLLPFLVIRLFKQLTQTNSIPQSDFKIMPLASISLPLVSTYCKWEQQLLRKRTLPFGLSLVWAVQKS